MFHVSKVRNYHVDIEMGDSFISITSLVISLVALIISMITYFAIDSVNEITSMEGKVLENEVIPFLLHEELMTLKWRKMDEKYYS